jgi:hypothetical protein
MVFLPAPELDAVVIGAETVGIFSNENYFIKESITDKVSQYIHFH